MKKFCVLYSLLILFLSASYAQTRFPDVEKLQLNNGLKVILCENHDAPQIAGAVYVHAGSKNDPADAKGTAAFLQNMLLFSGSDEIGSVNFAAEKPLLDSISALYDLLLATPSSAKRNDLLAKINVISAQAAQFAIPDEANTILAQLGCSDIRSFTTKSATVYYNTLPNSQLENWLATLSECFSNPSFRLFQSQQENMCDLFASKREAPFYNFYENINSSCLGTDYCGSPLYGTSKDLKNMTVSKVGNFFKTYYVPNNMTVILVGDFNNEEAKSLVEKTFGTFPMKEIPKASASPKISAKTVTTNDTPIRTGAVVFNGIKETTGQIELLCDLLSNDSKTGLLDNKTLLTKARCETITCNKNGLLSLIYIPKEGQSFDDAESLIMKSINDIKNGNFDTRLLDAIKTEHLTRQLLCTEGLENIFFTILNYEISDRGWKSYYADRSAYSYTSREDIIKTANNVFSNDCFTFRSNIGQAPQELATEYTSTKISTPNVGQSSAFATTLLPKTTNNNPASSLEKSSVTYGHNMILYNVDNPYNDYFTLNIYIMNGSLYNKDIPNAVRYINMLGVENLSAEDFNLELQSIGASFNLSCTEYNIIASISGHEKDFDKIMALCSKKLLAPTNDTAKLDMVKYEYSLDNQILKSDSRAIVDAVYEYASFGERSKYIHKPSSKDMEHYSGESLLNTFKESFYQSVFSTFAGNIDPQTVLNVIYNQIFNNFSLSEEKKEPRKLVKEPVDLKNNTVYILNDNHLTRSNISIHRISKTYSSKKEKALEPCLDAYLYYMMLQTSGRPYEFKSNRDCMYDIPISLSGYIETDGINAAVGLDVITGNEFIEDELYKKAQHKAAAQTNGYIYFRDLPLQMWRWDRMKYEEDPRTYNEITINKASSADFAKYYESLFQARPTKICIYGNLKQIGKKKLSEYGNIVKLKYSDIITE